MYEYSLRIPQSNIEIFNKITNGLIIAYTLLFILHNTIVGFYFLTWIERGELIIGLLLLMASLAKFLMVDGDSKIRWIKYNWAVIGYLAVRGILLVTTGFDTSLIRSILIEAVYLVAISDFVFQANDIKKILFKILIYINLFINIVNVIMYWLSFSYYLRNNDIFMNIVFYHTWLEKNPYYVSSALYSNPNTFGIMTAISLILVVIMHQKQKKLKDNISLIVYMVFSLYCLFISGCRSAQVGLLIVGIVWVTKVIVKKFSLQQITITCFVCCMLFMIGLSFYMRVNIGSGISENNMISTEKQINDLSTRRYFLWKSSTAANDDDILLGAGSQKMEINKRNSFIYNVIGYDSTIKVLNDHNGYFSMLFCSGVSGFIFFCIFLFKKIRGKRKKNRGMWNYILIFILIVNLFESAFIVNRLFIGLYLFLILAMDEECGRNADEVLEGN